MGIPALQGDLRGSFHVVAACAVAGQGRREPCLGVRRQHVDVVAAVALGILMIMAAMWMLSGSTADSGSADMMPAILFRGFGLGLLFLSITTSPSASSEIASAAPATGAWGDST